MVNASLNWASIVGIVLAVGGAGLYFMRSFKPALARDYDVFFAAIGLLCGGILFFQGWRLDPILQFSQFLLAATTVFFGYESVRLRGIATDQARRSSYFDDEPEVPLSAGSPSRRDWDSEYDRFDQPERISRRFASRDDQEDEYSGEDFYKPRRVSRAAIPEEAVSRRENPRTRVRNDFNQRDSEVNRRASRFSGPDFDRADNKSNFGERRNLRRDARKGSRPSPSERTSINDSASRFRRTSNSLGNEQSSRSSFRSGLDTKGGSANRIDDASFSSRPAMGSTSNQSSARPTSKDQRKTSTYSQSPPTRPRNRTSRSSSKPRDNSSRFDD